MAEVEAAVAAEEAAVNSAEARRLSQKQHTDGATTTDRGSLPTPLPAMAAAAGELSSNACCRVHTEDLRVVIAATPAVATSHPSLRSLRVGGACVVGRLGKQLWCASDLLLTFGVIRSLYELYSGTDSTKSRAEQAAAAAERRKTYPAGRILHLVPSRFVFAEAAAPRASAPSGDAAGIAGDDVRCPEEVAGRWERSERSWSEYDSSESSSEEDEDDLWEELDTPDSPPAASPGQPRVRKQDERDPADASSSLNGLSARANVTGGSAQLPSQCDASLGAGAAAHAADPTAAAVAIVGVRATYKFVLQASC
jgi:hypothetical protein